MKVSKAFMDTIEQYVITCADSDPIFAAKACNPNKNIEDCVTFILNEVQRSGINGFTDDEIYSMVKHYFIEEDINIGKRINCHVVVNHQVELTEEEIAEERQKARDKVFNDEVSRLKSVGKTFSTKIKQEETEQLLFSFE